MTNTTLARLEQEAEVLESALTHVRSAIGQLNGAGVSNGNSSPPQAATKVHWTQRLSPQEKAAWRKKIARGQRRAYRSR